MSYVNNTVMLLHDGAVPQVKTMLQRLPHSAAEIVAIGPIKMPLSRRGNVAVVSIEGPMLKPEWVQAFGFASTRAVENSVRDAIGDGDIDTLVLQADTPGGSVDGLAEAADAVYEAAQTMTVVTQVTGMLASAGCYVGFQADKVYAQRMDMVGSLGSRMTLYDFSGYYEENKVRAIPLDTSPKDRPFKSAGVEGAPITDKQEAEFQRIVDDYGTDFRQMITRGRGISGQDLDAVFDGRIWTANDALELGLIDGIQTLDQTLTGLEQNQESGADRSVRARAGLMSREIQLKA